MKIDWNVNKPKVGSYRDGKFILRAETSEILPIKPAMNLAIRLNATRLSGDIPHGLAITLRKSDSEHYVLGAVINELPARGSINLRADSEVSQAKEPCETLVRGQQNQFELAAIGQLFVWRIDGRNICTHRSDKLTQAGSATLFAGRASINFSDIEVINLDGLPEAEALRILGVDGKGNDLRALAAKQEQQKAEQAKVVDALAAIPELKTLHEQFVKLQAERVTAPFEAEVAKLNSGFLGGLDRKIAEMKQKGDLDAVLALEAEKQAVGRVFNSSSAEPKELKTRSTAAIPAEDDPATTAALKPLRQIYREAYAKLDATRAANLKLLTDPLSLRLKQLESTLTQQNRIEHAKTVREYREGLGRAAAPAAPPSGV